MEIRNDFRAMMDSYDVISVQISNRYYEGKSNCFYLRDAMGQMLSLDIKTVEHYTRDETMYRLAAPTNIVIGDEYMVLEEHARATPLEYALVVKTAQFEKVYGYDGDDLGVSYHEAMTSFALWAPTASAVKLMLWSKDNKGSRNHSTVVPMERTNFGVFRMDVHGDLDGTPYVYLVKVNGNWVESIDPYGKSSTANHQKSYVINPTKIVMDLNEACLPELLSATDAILYEASVRDFSKNLPTKDAGKFLGFIKPGIVTNAMKSAGFDYLKQLGITHVQLLPVYDFYTVDENHPKTFYNWGYDPIQWMVPEGSYASNANDPYARILELKMAIATLHQHGMRAIMDVVYNHFYSVVESSFDKIVPYYYFRRSGSGTLSNGSFCGNDFDSECVMGRKYIVDACVMWMREYGFDGFRFDLMGILDITTIARVVEKCKDIKPDAMFYGEGWNMPTFLADEKKASMNNHANLPGISFFNDKFRDIVKGKTDSAEINVKGYASGETSMIESMKAVLCGNALGNETGLQFQHPIQSVNYVECHDNATCWDKLKECCKEDDREMRLAKQKLMIGIIMVSQGIPFLHMGQEFCRTKNGVHNSYASKDAINGIDWNRKDRYQGVVDYTMDMIALRKRFACFRMHSKEQLLAHVEFEKFGDNILIYKLHRLEENEYDQIQVFLNPTNVIGIYNLDEEYEILANESGMVQKPILTHRLLINPSTMVVIGRKKGISNGIIV